MKIRIDDKFLAIIFENKHEETIIKSAFTFQDTSKVFTGGSYNSKYIKKVCFINKKEKYSFLYSGFLQDLLNTIKQNSIKISELSDKRTKFDFQKKKYTNEELGKFFPKFKYIEHQIRVFKKILRVSRGIISMPTSAGKGDVMIAYAALSKIPTLILVNRITLCNQLYSRFKKYGIANVGVCNSTKFIDGNVVISTINSVKKLNLTKFKCLIGDEIHNFSSKTFQDFLSEVNYPIQLGYSATPNKGDKYKYSLIRQFFGNSIVDVNSAELIENEVIAQPYIFFIENDCVSTIDWFSAYERCIINNEDRNNKIIEITSKLKVPTLILIKDVKNKQGEILCSEIEKCGKKVAFIHGSIKNREKYIELLENGELDVLISTDILNEGISIKNIYLLIVASAQKSFSSTAQKIGRCLRIKDNKTKAIVVDFTDEKNRFTERHAKIRWKTYQRLGFCNIVKLSKEDFFKYDKRKIFRNVK